MLYCYGENSFTYLLFNQLNQNNTVVSHLISRLKRFSTENGFSKKEIEELQSTKVKVWLFPNFGKSAGFGEPDALVLIGDYSFWIEIETTFDLVRRKSQARSALLQLLRFYYFLQSVKRGPTGRPSGRDHLAYLGPTLTGMCEPRDAVLRVAANPVLQEIRTAITNSARAEKDHYVIFSEKRMKGVSDGKLLKMFQEMAAEYDGLLTEHCGAEEDLIPTRPSPERFWYAYYENDLKKVMSIDSENQTYVSRHRG